MQWRLVLLYSLLGVPLTYAAVLGLLRTAAMEYAAWGAMMLVVAWLLGAAGGRTFLNGLATGALMAAWSHFIAAVHWDAYARNNPEFAAQMAAQAEQLGVTPSVFQVISIPMVAVMYGPALGVLAWIAGKLAAARSAGPKPTEPAQDNPETEG